MPIQLPRLEAVPEAGLYACIEYEGEDRILMHCPMLADGTADTDSYGPVDLDACETSTLEAIDAVLGTSYSEPKPPPKESREIRGHRCYGRVVEVEAPSEAEARVLAARTKGSDYHTWEAKETAPGKWSCFVCAHDDVFALND